MDSGDWISTAQAAQRLGVTTARIRQLIAEGALAARKLGGKYRGQWLVSAADVEQRRRKEETEGTMKVKMRMTPSPITAMPRTNYNQALRLMKQNHIQHLPIVDAQGALVGIVSLHDMLRAEPSRVSTLSVYEVASLLETVSMAQIMSHPVMAVDEDCSISNAARYMLDQDIGCLPVMRGSELVGVITDTDIFETFVEITGGGQSGSRIEARMPDQKGQLAGFVRAFSNAGSYIVSVALTYDDAEPYFYADLKERGGDEARIREELTALGTVEVIEFRPDDEDELLSFG